MIYVQVIVDVIMVDHQITAAVVVMTDVVAAAVVTVIATIEVSKHIAVIC